MDTQCTTATNPGYTVNFNSGNGDEEMSEEEELEQEGDDEEQSSGNRQTSVGRISTLAQHSLPAVMAQTQGSALADWTSNTEGETVFNSNIPEGECRKSDFMVILKPAVCDAVELYCVIGTGVSTSFSLHLYQLRHDNNRHLFLYHNTVNQHPKHRPL